MLRIKQWPHSLRALQHRNFRLYWSSQIVSFTGTWMQTLALSWLIFRITDSPLMLGLVNLVGLIPVLPISLFSGVISDRFSRKSIILLSDSVLVLQAFILAFLTWQNTIQVWQIIILSFIFGAAVALEQPARLAFVVDLVGKDDLTNATALNSAVFNNARIFGPALAGFTVAWIGEAGCFFINGISYLFVILVLLVIRVKEDHLETFNEKVGASLKYGIKFVLQDRTVRALMAIVGIASFFTMSYVTLTTVFAEDVLNAGSEGLGFLMAAVGCGAIIGALFVANLKKGGRGKWLTASNIIGPAILIIFSLSSSLFPSLILIAIVAVNSATRQILSTSLIQISTPDSLQGRVMSIFTLVFNGMSRVGVVFIGGIAEFTGIAWAVGLGALISLLWGIIVIWRMPHIYRLP